MRIIIWGIISSVIGIGGGILGKNPVIMVMGITIGILTCLHYKAVMRRLK